MMDRYLKIKRIREYEIIEPPKAGNYGIVYIGRHRKMRYTRAIKGLLPHVRPQLILEEAKNQQTVTSQHVVQVIDFFERPHYILMEYCKYPLDYYLQQRFRQTSGRIPYDEARELIFGILKGINDAHKAQVIHGDIKPGNVLIGEDDLPKLGDFGAARRLRQTFPALKGSANWMAPEVAMGADATEESDYFSFGILSYLIIEGSHPFFANDPTCLTSEQENITSDSFSPKPISRTDVPRQVLGLIEELLSKKDPNRRAKAAEDLKAALAPSLQVEPEAAITAVSPPSLSEAEAAEMDQTNSSARHQFFVSFNPKGAVETLEKFLDKLEWGRFRNTGISKLSDLWSLKAFIHNSAGFYKEAIASSTNGLEISSNHVNCLHTRGYAHIQLGQYDEAKQDLKKALQFTTDADKRGQIAKLLNTVELRLQLAPSR